MYPEAFNKCIEIVLKSEGGFQRNPNDSGNWSNGKLVGTKYGIAARFFPGLDIKNLTIEGAKTIYYEKYWKPMNLIGITSGDVVLQIFDFGVNAGRGTSIRIAQRLVKVKADGKLGPISKYAINNFPDFLDAFKTARILYYRKIAEKPRNAGFLQGWLNRVSNTHF